MEWFENWGEIARVFFTAIIIYAFTIVCLRFAGKRTTSKMNLFDWVITVCLGSVIASVIVIEKVMLLEGFVAVGTLVLLQFAVSRLSTRSRFLAKAVCAQPTILYKDGEYQQACLKEERVLKAEIHSAVRKAGYTDMSQVKLVILEPDTSMSVIPAGTADGDLVDEDEFKDST